MPVKDKTDVIITGAGLTGLTLAYYLKKGGMDVLILEKANHTGGVIGTVEEDGFVYETGPNTGILSTPEIVELFEDLSGQVTPELPAEASEARWIWKGGRWHALPSGLGSAIATPLFTWKDKFRVLGEPFRKAGSDPDESVADLVRRRLGKSFLDYAVDPFISGIYAGDPERLVTRHALPKLYNLEQNYGSFIGGAIKKRSEPKSERDKKATRKVFSVRGGLQRLTDALTKEISMDNILLGCPKVAFEKSGQGYQAKVTLADGTLRTVRSGFVVTTGGGPQLASMLDFVPEALLQPIMTLNYARVVQVAAGYRKWDGIPIPAFGGLIPSIENREALGILFPSSIFKGRAPEEGALLSIFLGGLKRPDILDKTDEEIKEAVLKEIRETLHPSAAAPDLFRLFRYPHAIPQYERSTGARYEAITKIQEMYPGLILAGNIRDGIGMADRVKQGRQLADQILEKR